MSGESGGILFSAIMLAVLLFYIYVGWRIFEKADQPGWAAIVPIYNLVVLLRIVGRPMWWIILLLIPIVNFIAAAIIYIDLSKSFGKGTGFGIGLLLLGVIFGPILAFGDATYQGPAAAD
jgi:hypothetical protein